MARYKNDDINLSDVPTSEIEKTIEIVFNQNRTHELHLKTRMLRFGPYEKQSITSEEYESEQFKNHDKYFTVIQ